jgi:hypothetical protein
MKITKGFMLFLACLGLVGVTSVAAASSHFADNVVYALNRTSNTITCPNGLRTDLDDNVSDVEVLSLVEGHAESTAINQTKADSLKAYSDIIGSVDTFTNVYYADCAGIKLGSSSKKGEFKITLSKSIKAIGLYAVAFNNKNDAGGTKTFTVNGSDVGDTLSYDVARYYYTFNEAVTEVSIAGKVSSNNRFYIKSIGFYYE